MLPLRVVLAALPICSSCAGGIESAAGNDIVIDTSELDPFVDESMSMALMGGTVRASRGIDHVLVGNGPVTLAGEHFSATVAVTPGLVEVPIRVFDRAQPPHSRKGDRTLLVGTFLAEGARNVDALSIPLTASLLSDLAQPLAQDVAAIHVAQQILDLDHIEAGDCRVEFRSATQDPTRLEVTPAASDGHIRAQVVVPNLRVEFKGKCHVTFFDVDFHGRLKTTIRVTSILTAVMPPVGECVSAFSHSYPTVALQNWDLNVDGSGLVDSVIVDLFEGRAGSQVRDGINDQVAQRVDEILSMRLQGLDLERHTDAAIRDVPVTIAFCPTRLSAQDHLVRATLGVRVQGAGSRPAPGAPMVAGALEFDPDPMAWWVDSGLLAQILFSTWRGGGLSDDSVGSIDFSLLAALIPSLEPLYPPDARVRLGIEGRLPPRVYAADPTVADLVIELGDLVFDASVEGTLLFRVGATITLQIELKPRDGKLVPAVKHVTAQSRLLSSPRAELEDAAIESVANTLIQARAASILESLSIELPAIGSAKIIIADVAAVPGGRYFKLLQPLFQSIPSPRQ